MLNFEFHNPTRIVFGANTIPRLAELVPPTARVLILYGGHSAKKSGTLDEVKAALGRHYVQEFSGIEPNPTYETLMHAVEQVRKENLDFLLAVGGGSVIDGTKFVAAAINHDGDPWDILLTHGKAVTSAVPFASVLTLPATGSEMNCASVITRQSTQSKLAFINPQVFPQFSILDPTKTYTLPKNQVANGIADTFVHIAEQYLTYPAQGLAQDRFAEGLMQTLIEIAPKTLDRSDDYDTRANFMWTATLALNGIIGAGVPQDWATHMIGHEITALYGIDHARTLAIVLPSLLREQQQSKRGKLLQYAQRVWNITEGSEDQRIDQAIRRTQEFFEGIGIKTHLSDYKIGRDGIDDIVKQLETHGLTALGERQQITLEVSRAILNGAY